jgi:hypothetical protein
MLSDAFSLCFFMLLILQLLLLALTTCALLLFNGLCLKHGVSYWD